MTPAIPTLMSSISNPFPRPQFTPLPDNVVVVSQEEFLAVLSGVVHHSYPSYKVNHLLAGGVVQVVAALVTPVPVHPLQPELAIGSCPIRHYKPTPSDPRCPARLLCPLPRLGLRRTCKGSGYSAGRRFPRRRTGTAQHAGRHHHPLLRETSRRRRRCAAARPRWEPRLLPSGPGGFGGTSTSAHASLHLRASAPGRGSPPGHPAFKIRDLHIQTRITQFAKFVARGGFAASSGIYSVTGLI